MRHSGAAVVAVAARTQCQNSASVSLSPVFFKLVNRPIALWQTPLPTASACSNLRAKSLRLGAAWPRCCRAHAALPLLRDVGIIGTASRKPLAVATITARQAARNTMTARIAAQKSATLRRRARTTTICGSAFSAVLSQNGYEGTCTYVRICTWICRCIHIHISTHISICIYIDVYM